MTTRNQTLTDREQRARDVGARLEPGGHVFPRRLHYWGPGPRKTWLSLRTAIRQGRVRAWTTHSFDMYLVNVICPNPEAQADHHVFAVARRDNLKDTHAVVVGDLGSLVLWLERSARRMDPKTGQVQLA